MKTETTVWDWGYAWDIVPTLLKGLLTTVEITLLAAVIALVVGLAVAVVRYSHVPVISQLFGFLVQFVRGTPLLVQAYFAYYVLPKVGLQASAFLTGTIVLGLNYSAYTAEAYRGGIQGVPRGQWEAATALSLPSRRVWQSVVLPQAFRASLPALGNYVIAMFKDSAVLAAITVYELLNRAESVGADSFRYLEPLTLAGVLYLLVSYPSARLIRQLEVRLAHPH